LELKTVDNKADSTDEKPADEPKPEKEEHGPKHTVDVTAADFEEKVLKSTLPVVVDFWAPWCGPCLAIAPRIDAIAEEYSGRVVVAKFNLGNEQELWERFNIKGIPTLIVYKDGKELKRLGGQEPYQFLKNEFDQLITQPLQEAEEIAAARAELHATIDAAMRKHNDERGRAFDDVAKAHCPQEMERFSQSTDFIWAECDKANPELKAKHDAGEMGDFDYAIARAEAMRKFQSDPANEQLLAESKAATEAFHTAMKPHMAEYEALVKKAEEDNKATVEEARRRFNQRVAELTSAEPKKTFRRRVIFTSDNIEKVTVEDTVSVADAVQVIANNDLLFPSYVARFSQNRIVVATPTLSVMIEFVGPVEDMYEIYKVLKHRKRPEPKPVRSELETALDALH
jgi:thioredoxin 1